MIKCKLRMKKDEKANKGRNCPYAGFKRKIEPDFDCDCCEYNNMPVLPLGPKIPVMTSKARKKIFENSPLGYIFDRQEKLDLLEMLQRSDNTLEGLYRLLGEYLDSKKREKESAKL